jgi:hypothetical protein
VQMVGRVLLLYKRHPQKPRYEGKRAKVDKPGAAGASARPQNRRTKRRTKRRT